MHELMTEFQHLFALSDLELGCTSLVKHRINVNNPVPFKERYRRIPPREFDEVRNHLQEMLKVGAIRKSVSPWASPVVLVRHKDGSLRFCIDLKHNKRCIQSSLNRRVVRLSEWGSYIYIIRFESRVLAGQDG